MKKIIIAMPGQDATRQDFWQRAIVDTGLEPYTEVAFQAQALDSVQWPIDLLQQYGTSFNISKAQTDYTTARLGGWTPKPYAYSYLDYEPNRGDAYVGPDRHWLWNKMVNGLDAADKMVLDALNQGVVDAIAAHQTEPVLNSTYRIPPLQRSQPATQSNYDLAQTGAAATVALDWLWYHVYPSNLDNLSLVDLSAELNARHNFYSGFNRPQIPFIWPSYQVADTAQMQATLAHQIAAIRNIVPIDSNYPIQEIGVWVDMTQPVNTFIPNRQIDHFISIAPVLLEFATSDDTPLFDEWADNPSVDNIVGDSLSATYFKTKETTIPSPPASQSWNNGIRKIQFSFGLPSATQFPEVFYDNFLQNHGVHAPSSKFCTDPGPINTKSGKDAKFASYDNDTHYGVPQIWLRNLTTDTFAFEFIDDPRGSILSSLNLKTGVHAAGATINVIDDYYISVGGADVNLLGSYTITSVDTLPASTRYQLSPDNLNLVDDRKIQSIVITKTAHGLSPKTNPLPLIDWLDIHPSVASLNAPIVNDTSGIGYPKSRYKIQDQPDTFGDYSGLITASNSTTDTYNSKNQKLNVRVDNSLYTTQSYDSINFFTSVFNEQDPRGLFPVGSNISVYDPAGAGFTNVGIYTVANYFVGANADIIMSVVDGQITTELSRSTLTGMQSLISPSAGPVSGAPNLFIEYQFTPN